jgi:hypothetical protein
LSRREAPGYGADDRRAQASNEDDTNALENQRLRLRSDDTGALSVHQTEATSVDDTEASQIARVVTTTMPRKDAADGNGLVTPALADQDVTL